MYTLFRKTDLGKDRFALKHIGRPYEDRASALLFAHGLNLSITASVPDANYSYVVFDEDGDEVPQPGCELLSPAVADGASD